MSVSSSSSSPLIAVIAEQIQAQPQRRITFADYMELALYHPQHGYYATAPSQIGTSGDFFTSPHLGSEFGELVAEQMVQFWEILHQPQPFTLVEMGAGQGLLAQQVLTHLQQQYPDLYANLEYIIVERSAALIAEQQQQLQGFQADGLALSWRTWEELPSNSITGCLFSNELVDAFPVHQVAIAAERLQEIYVTLNESASAQTPFTEVQGDLSTPRLADYFRLVDVELPSARYPDGYRTEVNLAALDWMTTVASRLRQGFVLTIDYGYSSDRYYNPMRSQGTLQCYYRHAHHNDPYAYVGQQDITAHVDFTALERQGEQGGLVTEGFTRQGLFLMALGLGERFSSLSQSQATDGPTLQAVLQHRDALQRLVDPMGLGNFGVLIQSKGIEAALPLRGLQGEVLTRRSR